MMCPQCHTKMRHTEAKSLRLQRCPKCRGAWYEAEELRLLKDLEDKGDYRWIDIDLWRDAEKFAASEPQRGRKCPNDGSPLLTVHYGDSEIHVDICQGCEGVWLDGGEYPKILRYLEEKVDSETVGDYLHDLREEFVEIFTGGEGPGSEVSDFLKVLHLLELRFVVEHGKFSDTLRRLGRGIPGAT